MTQQTGELNRRELAMLRAIADGRAEITCSREPDLFIDGLACCDQFLVHRLARRGLIICTRPGKPDEHGLAAASRSALALPIPRLAPVTSTVGMGSH